MNADLEGRQEICLEWGDSRYNQLLPFFKEGLLQDIQNTESPHLVGRFEVTKQFQNDFNRGHTFSVQYNIMGQAGWITSDIFPGTKKTEKNDDASPREIGTNDTLEALFQGISDNNQKKFPYLHNKEAIIERSKRDLMVITGVICQTPINKIIKALETISPFKFAEGKFWVLGGGSSHHVYIRNLGNGAYAFDHCATIRPNEGAGSVLKDGMGVPITDKIGRAINFYLDLEKSFATLKWSTHLQLDHEFHGNNYNFTLATPLDIQYKLVEKVENVNSHPRFVLIHELRNFFNEITRPIVEFFNNAFFRRGRLS